MCILALSGGNPTDNIQKFVENANPFLSSFLEESKSFYAPPSGPLFKSLRQLRSIVNNFYAYTSSSPFIKPPERGKPLSGKP